jgi:hypothetical protein
VQYEYGPAGCSKRPSSKAAASEGARRTLGVHIGSERCKNAAGGLFQQPASSAKTARRVQEVDSVEILVLDDQSREDKRWSDTGAKGIRKDPWIAIAA